ncbi:MAG: hypothetical protein IPH04_03440 [Saprospirales bacterium]|jgi:hypothetical protein|nr:hypothetical protein [Saprospirales bacterium]MBK6901877.1 hypothetical protein [Saprospirales bacterium]MBK7336467.1 hypothetical protein [Saprospirales bacterium]
MNRVLRISVFSTVALMAGFLVQAGDPPASPSVERYCNARYGFCLDYPGAVLNQKHVSENNDGVAVLSADGNYQLRVYGYFNVMGWSVSEEYQDFLEVIRSNNNGAPIKELEKNFTEDQFEVLLQVGKMLHYEKTILKGNHFISLTLEANRRGNLSFEDSQVQLKQLLDETNLSIN